MRLPPMKQGRVGVVASRTVRLRALGLDTATLKGVTLVSPAYLQVLEVIVCTEITGHIRRFAFPLLRACGFAPIACCCVRSQEKRREK